MMISRKLLGVSAVIAVAGSAASGSDYNAGEWCPVAADGPDVTLCQVYGIQEASRSNPQNISGLTVGTTSWNVGTERLLWFNSPNPDHPFITFNVYRLMDGQFDQIAQGWVKHGFFALSSSQCFDATVGGCQSTSGDWLGIGCTDTYSPALNASKSGLAPRYEINPWTGDWSYQGSVFQTGNAPTSGVSRHMQIKDADLDPALNPGASYFFEAYYVAKDDICVYNNAGWKPMTPIQSGNGWNFSQTGQTAPVNQNFLIFDARPGSVLTEIAEELPVVEFESPDGRAFVSALAEDYARDEYRYNYSVKNIDMDRQISEFRVPLPASANLVSSRFHAVFHHDEPIAYMGGPAINNDEWTMTREGDEIVWSTETNPIRWGTMYSFGFITDAPPTEGEVTLGMFKSGGPDSLSGISVVPEVADAPCPGDVNGDGVVDLNDLNLVLTNFGQNTSDGDANGDGVVDLNDLNLVLTNFGISC
jgi:hypothetical protein